jgi:hypothetical protein
MITDKLDKQVKQDKQDGEINVGREHREESGFSVFWGNHHQQRVQIREQVQLFTDRGALAVFDINFFFFLLLRMTCNTNNDFCSASEKC